MLAWLFDTSVYPARWYCGDWSAAAGWLHIASDLATWGAYMAIPLVLLYFTRKRKDVPFLKVFWLFGIFIFACGTVHAIEALIFWWPVYNLSGLVKLVTAVASWATVVALIYVTPKALRLPAMARINEQLAAEIAEREKAERAMIAAKESAERANRAKSQFLANMSHELRTPLNAIIGYSEMLAEEAEDTGQGELFEDLKRIQHAGHHLLELVNDVLELSRIEAGKSRISVEPFSVAGMLESLGHTIEPLARSNGNAYEFEAVNELGTMRSDATKIRQCLLNLLANACKFTKTGTITMQAERIRENGEDWLCFQVRDTGIGMNEEELKRIFKAFAQAEQSTTREHGGSGLGLTITRNFARMLGGDVTVKSEKGNGSEFSLKLPAHIHRGHKESAIPIPLETPKERTKTSNRQRTILVIEDDNNARELLKRLLERESWAVVVAQGGAEGLRKAREIHPDLITLDVLMPDLDGWSVLSQLKNTPHLRHIPVVIVSVLHEQDLAYSLGASEFLTKPVDQEQLRLVLDAYEQRRHVGPVLIVDDDPRVRELVSHHTQRAGWDVATAGDGEQALQVMRILRPAVVLLDLLMPVMDGFALCEAMHQDAELRDIPRIVLTGLDLTEAERALLNGRVEAILQKGNLRPSQLLAQLECLLDPEASY